MPIFRCTFFVVILALASFAEAGADSVVDRRYFAIALGSGWKAVEDDPRAAIGDPEDAALIADMGVTVRSRQATVTVIGAPLSPDMSMQDMIAIQHPEPKTVIARSDFSEFAGHKGLGRTLTIQHAFPVYTVLSRFSFEENGCVCTISWSSSAEKAADAARTVERQRDVVESLVRGITVRDRPKPTGSR